MMINDIDPCHRSNVHGFESWESRSDGDHVENGMNVLSCTINRMVDGKNRLISRLDRVDSKTSAASWGYLFIYYLIQHHLGIISNGTSLPLPF